MSLHHHFGGFWCLWRHGFVFPSFLLVSIVCIESTQQHLNNFWGGCLLGELIFWDWVFCPSKSKTPWESDKSSWGCRSRKTSHRPGTWKTSILESSSKFRFSYISHFIELLHHLFFQQHAMWYQWLRRHSEIGAHVQVNFWSGNDIL